MAESGLWGILNEFNMISSAARMLLAILCGGLIGLEREKKRRPAGFRTYMLVCLGAAMTMLLSQYEALMLTTHWADYAGVAGATTDVSRFGAQVINGIGFLGAGTIIVTGRQEVKGLTTAAGLWASACMGLAIGAGFYECVLVGFLFIVLSFKVFPLIENEVTAKGRNMNLYVELDSTELVGQIIAVMKAIEVKIYDIEIYRGTESDMPYPSAVFAIRLPQRLPHISLLAMVSAVEGIRTIEEI